MPEITSSLKEFSHALKSGSQVNVTRDGRWYIEGWFMRVIRWLFDMHGPRVRNVINAVSRIFDDMQNSPLDLNGDFTKYKRIIKAAKSAKIALKNVRPYDYKKQKSILDRKIIAMSYWVGPKGGGFNKDKAVNQDVLTQATALASAYKRSLWQFSEEKEDLHPADHKLLRQTALYPEFVKRLEKVPHLRDEFFGFTIRYLNPPAVFIEHPPVAKRVRENYVSGSLGRFAYHDSLKIVDDGNTKTITLPFGGKDFSIVDPKGTFYLPGEPETPIKVVFDDMRDRDTETGSYNFMGKQGFIHFNVHTQATYNPVTEKWDSIEINADGWWEKLPDYEKRVAKEDIMSRNELKVLQDDQWVILLASAKQSEGTRFDDCHGYTEVSIPNGDGTWNVIPIGKYPTKYPKGTWEFLWFLTNTTPADVALDPNPGYGAIRQFAGHVKVATEKQGRMYMEAIRLTMERGRQGKLFFSFGGSNCSDEVQKWAESVFGRESEEGEIPELYLAKITDAECPEPLNSIIQLAKDLPEKMGDTVLLNLAKLLRSGRAVDSVDINGKPTKISVRNGPFHKGTMINGKKKYCHIQLPSKLHENIKNKVFPGIIWSGFQRMQPRSWIEAI